MEASFQHISKVSISQRTLKTAYWIEMIDYSIEYQDIRGHIAERLYGKQYNKFCKQPRPKMQRYASEMSNPLPRMKIVWSS